MRSCFGVSHFAFAQMQRTRSGTVICLLCCQAVLLAYCACRHSPTWNEPAHLVAGLAQWRFWQFDTYSVNTPLVHFVAAIPVILAGYEDDRERIFTGPGDRPEYVMGDKFVEANGKRSLTLFIFARWGCIPICLCGGICCFLWSKELWQSSRPFCEGGSLVGCGTV